MKLKDIDFVIVFFLIIGLAVIGIRFYNEFRKDAELIPEGSTLCTLDGKAYKTGSYFFQLRAYEPQRDAAADKKCSALKGRAD